MTISIFGCYLCQSLQCIGDFSLNWQWWKSDRCFVCLLRSTIIRKSLDHLKYLCYPENMLFSVKDSSLFARLREKTCFILNWKQALLYHTRKPKPYSWWEGLPVRHFNSSKSNTISRSLRQFSSIKWRQTKILQPSNLILSEVADNKLETILKESVSYPTGIKGWVTEDTKIAE